MKNKKIMMITLVIISILIPISSSILANNVNPAEETITLSYRDYQYYSFNSPQQVNLSYISSNIQPEALTITKQNYYPSSNETKYLFTSNQITIESDFIPEIKTFIYQDINTGQLYNIKIDMTTVTVPSSNLAEQYQNLTQNYTLLENEYHNLTDEINDLEEQYTSLNNTLHETEEELQTTAALLEEKQITLQNTTENYSTLKQNYTTLLTTYNETQKELNNTLATLMNKSRNLSILERFKNDIDSTSTRSFMYNGESYKSKYAYEKEILQKNDELGMIPSYLIMAIILTFLITYMIVKNIYEKNNPTPAELAEQGYSPKAQKYNNFIIGKLSEKADEIKKRLNAKQHYWNQEKTEEKTSEKPSMDDKIDRLLASTGGIKQDVTSMKDEITDIRTNVDTLDKRVNEIDSKKNKKSKKK